MNNTFRNTSLSSKSVITSNSSRVVSVNVHSLDIVILGISIISILAIIILG